uniref:Methyltransferase type 11 domain-containing protein n=1 Tax=Hyaloperonospora arabidopsidis (strain Emoy2) TaxID=559515 RepID=M4BX87_HYAAE
MPEMKWIEADMTTLSSVFGPESFDVVIDKAAMDALMCDEGDVWSPSEAVIKQAAAMCSGITSVLASKGTFLQISFAQPHFRRRFLLGEDEQAPTSTVYDWRYSYRNIDMGLGYFFYVLQKCSHV